MKALPFSVNRNAAVALTEQIVDGITSAIRGGYYEPGDRLPSLSDMAASLDVGIQTVRAAIGVLSERGDLVARRKRGIQVVDRNKCWFTRHVVHLRFGGPTYYFSAKDEHLAELLTDASIRTTIVRMGPHEYAAGFPHLRTALDCHHVDLVVIDGPSSGLISELESRRIAYICAGDLRPVPCAAGSLIIDHRPAYTAFAAHCQALGIAHVGAIFSGAPHSGLLEEVMAETRLRCELIVAPRRPGGGSPEAIERTGWETVRAVLGRSEPLPELLYFSDDYLARGGLTALLAAGIAVPDQVQVVAQVNAGFCPVFPCELTRLEMEPRRDAEALFALIRDVLAEPPRPLTRTVSPRFVVGQSTRPVS